MAGLDPSPPGRPKAKYDGSAPASEDRPRRRDQALRRRAESRRLPYWPRGPAASSIDLDFLGRSRFCPRKPRKQGLDFLGFPWISLDTLSSESRFINGLRGILGEENFSRPFVARQRAGRGAGILTMQKRSVAHRASLTRFLLFCNQLPTTEMAILSRAADGALVISLNPQLDGKIVELGYRVKCRCNRKVSVIGISVPVSQSKLGGISLLPCSAKKAA